MPARLPTYLRRIAALAIAFGITAALSGCYSKGDIRKPIPSQLVPSASTTPTAARRLVVVLPGRGDDVADLARSGIAASIQSAWPDADVLLTGLSLGFYMQGTAEQRLHDEVVAPARARGYRSTWVLGASMGGMGAIMYDARYPLDADGIVLLSPYLGERPLLDEISAAGGIAAWQPGAVPAVVDKDNFQRELWRHVQGWQRNPADARRVWLAYGDRDRLRTAMPVLVPALVPGHVTVIPGGHHAWTTWSPAAADALRAADPAATPVP